MIDGEVPIAPSRVIRPAYCTTFILKCEQFLVVGSCYAVQLCHSIPLHSVHLRWAITAVPSAPMLSISLPPLFFLFRISFVKLFCCGLDAFSALCCPSIFCTTVRRELKQSFWKFAGGALLHRFFAHAWFLQGIDSRAFASRSASEGSDLFFFRHASRTALLTFYDFRGVLLVPTLALVTALAARGALTERFRRSLHDFLFFVPGPWGVCLLAMREQTALRITANVLLEYSTPSIQALNSSAKPSLLNFSISFTSLQKRARQPGEQNS